MEASKQQQFDWPRSRQLAALRDCRLPDLPAKDNTIVKGGVAKAVLTVLDQYGRECFAAQQTIADTVGFSLRHVKRALYVLEAISLITRERKKNVYGVTTNHYRIVWTELEQLLRSKVPPRHFSSADQSAVATDQSAVATDQSAVAAHNPPRSAKKEDPPPPSSQDVAADGAAWAEVERVFCALGISEIAVLVETAQARCLSPRDCLRLAEHFSAHTDANDWGPGVLYRRIENALPGEDDEQRTRRWMPPSAAAQRRQREAARERERARAAAVEAQAREATVETTLERQTLESRYGPAIDALPKEAQRQLVALAYDDQAFALQAFGKNGLRCWVRTRCLELIATDAEWLSLLTNQTLLAKE